MFLIYQWNLALTNPDDTKSKPVFQEIEHRDNPDNDEEDQKTNDDSENRTREGEVTSEDRNEATENQQNHSPRSERSEEDDLAFYLNQTRPKSEEKQNMPAEGSARGAREGTPLQGWRFVIGQKSFHGTTSSNWIFFKKKRRIIQFF